MKQSYEHKVQYYETDQMGIVHHSNFIRWFEEARVDFMEQAGMGYEQLELSGVISPVLGINCDYKGMVHFGDRVLIEAKIKVYNGIKMVVAYEVVDKETGELRAVGESKHCFLDKEGKPISLKKVNPNFHQLFGGLLLENSEATEE